MSAILYIGVAIILYLAGVYCVAALCNAAARADAAAGRWVA